MKEIDKTVIEGKDQLLSQALNLHSAGKYAEAANKYQLFLDRGFSDQRVLSNYGVICIHLRNKDKAVELFNQSIQEYPDYSSAYSNLARLLSDRRKYDQAEQLFKKYISLKPNAFKGYYLFGSHLLRVNKIKEAQNYFYKAINIQPNICEIYYQLGLTYKILNDMNKAELLIRKSIELKPTFFSSYVLLADIFILQGKLKEAEISLRKVIKLKDDLPIAYSNLGSLLRELGNNLEAESLTRKAIELKPDFHEAHNNLAVILRDLHKHEDASLSALRSISISKNFAKAYLTLSTLRESYTNHEWETYLFSDQILENQSDMDKIDIFFARAKILEANHNFLKSSENFIHANQLNRKIYSSDYESIKSKIKKFILLSRDIKSPNFMNKDSLGSLQPIFIVGLPRSGKTMVESILDCNSNLIKLKEDIALENTVNQYFKSDIASDKASLNNLFLENLDQNISPNAYISITNPSNYIYTGLIVNHILNSKVIFCYRNPLDHSKEMFCKPLGSKYTFTSSIEESVSLCIYLESVMSQYKDRFKSSIYCLNYDLLVTDPKKEISNLLNWLGWRFEHKYLYPSLDITTNVSKKGDNSSINSNELFSWRNYKDMLKPAIKIIKQEKKYEYLFI